MNIAQILVDLDHAEGLPRDALRAATEHRAELVPRLIDAFETYTPEDGDEPLLFFGFLLLGQWRETSAYRPLCRFLRRMGNHIDTLMGDDTVTETANRVMASVYDGDPTPLYEVVYDRDADEYVRGAMCTALAMLTARGQLSRAEMERFLREAFDRLKPKRGSFVWGGWEEAIVELGMVELKPLLQAAFNRGSIDITWSTFDESVKALDEAVANGCANIAGADRHFTPFGDVVDELSSWHAFSEKATEERAKRRQEDALALVAALPIPRRTADSLHDVPLKAPCPCGSGRKYKHCHGRVH